MMNKEKYIQFCEQNDFVPIFSQPWWMDAVCVDGYWDVLLYEKNGEVLGALPYYVKKRWGISYITQPQFTQNNGVVIKYPDNQKYEKKFSYEKEVMTALIEQLEKLPVAFYQQNFNCKYTNWLPFYWKGYTQTTVYTYMSVGGQLQDENELLKTYGEDKRKNIKRALKKGLYVTDNLTVSDFYDFHSNCLVFLNQKISYSYELLNNIVSASIHNNAGKIIAVRDSRDNLLAATFFIWDSMCVYGIDTAIHHGEGEAGALLFHEELKFAWLKKIPFNMGGSMIEDVENSYRRFGTIQTPYFFIHKIMTKNPLLRILIDRKLK